MTCKMKGEVNSMRKLYCHFGSFFKEERGAILIIVALSMVALLGMTALAIDVGDLYGTRREMVNAADAAALAGARELALGGSESEAISVATSIAQTNNADLIHNISVETRNYEGESYEVVVAEVGRNVQHYFAPILGITDSDVYAQAVATWGYPKKFGDILPIFYVVEEGYDLPEGEQLLISEMLVPGNWGFLSLDQPGANELNRVLSGGETSYFDDFDIGEEITEDDIIVSTQTGNIAAIKNGVENRMEKAHAEKDPSIMEGFIPILREIEGEGKTIVVVVGFAPFRIDDIVMDYNRDEGKWYATGNNRALVEYTPFYNEPFYIAPKYYGEGFDIPKDARDEYPQYSIIGQFISEKFISAWDYLGGMTQNPDYDFGAYVVRLVE